MFDCKAEEDGKGECQKFMYTPNPRPCHERHQCGCNSTNYEYSNRPGRFFSIQYCLIWFFLSVQLVRRYLCPGLYSKACKKRNHKDRLVHGLLRCTTCSRIWNRDVNGAINILHIAKAALGGDQRPKYLCYWGTI